MIICVLIDFVPSLNYLEGDQQRMAQQILPFFAFYAKLCSKVLKPQAVRLLSFMIPLLLSFDAPNLFPKSEVNTGLA